VVLLNDPTVNGGLGANLVGSNEPDRVSHHGFKAMEITASALTAEALKLTMPASVFSRSTEGQNQDKTSMGTIAARDCLAVVDLTESVAAVHLLAVCQALSLGNRPAGPGSARVLQAVRAQVPPLGSDRPMDDDLRTVRRLIAEGALGAPGGSDN
jgi:histidine ammonia-lyase